MRDSVFSCPESSLVLEEWWDKWTYKNDLYLEKYVFPLDTPLCFSDQRTHKPETGRERECGDGGDGDNEDNENAGMLGMEGMVKMVGVVKMVEMLWMEGGNEDDGDGQDGGV